MSYRRKNKYHYKEEKRSQIVFSADPLALTGPSPTDIENEALLEKVLRSAGRLKENRLEAQQREYVLQELNEICQEWVQTSARKHNHPEEFVSNSKVRLYAFGSYKLDVHSLGDDVDLLCVGPRFLTRDMFFEELGPILTSNSCVTNFYSVPNAYVPVMTFKYNSIDIDLVYASLQIELLDSEWDINDDRNLRNLEQTSIVSLNGVRLAHKTLDLVPNKDVFRLSLRAIRYWAKQRGIYSNKLGYLGGVSWAILCGRVCQLYPNANASQIVQNFFLFYHIWNFGTPLKAITLCNIVQHEDMPSVKVWDPNDQTAKYELMHIITPAFPAMNSTHNVSMSTFEVLKKEIARAFHMLSRAKNSLSGLNWAALFEANTFFMDHKNYIFVKACAPKKNVTEWSGLIESKIRSFVSSLEQYSDVSVTPLCKHIRLKLKQPDIDAHTHPEIVKEQALKRKQRLEKQRQRKIQLKKQKLEQIRLQKLHLKLQKERQNKQQNEEKKEDTIDEDTSTKESVDTPNHEETTDNSTPIKDEPHTKNTEINEDDPVVIESKTKSEETCTNNDDDVVIVSNLSLPIENIEPKTKTSPSVSASPVVTPSVVTSTAVVNKPSNPYIYVAPELQRKYTFKGRNRRNNFYNRRRMRYNSNRTYSMTSPSASTATTNGNAKDTSTANSPTLSSTNGGTKDGKSPSLSSPNQPEPMAPPMLPNPHAFVVGKRQIACCQSFNNKLLREKAEKYGDYECRAFVIGLKVMTRIMAIDTLSDGQQIEQRQSFDFSRGVLSFMKGLPHLYTDAHLIIQLIGCNKIPHYLFPQYEYRRPSKETIKSHQADMDAKHGLWKSKKCTATLAEEEQKALDGNADAQNTTPSNGDEIKKETDAICAMNGDAVNAPHFDKDDRLMNDDDEMEAMPGLTQQTKDVGEEEQEEEDVVIDKDVMMKEEEEASLNELEPSLKRRKLMNGEVEHVQMETKKGTEEEVEQNYMNPYYESIDWNVKVDNSPTYEYALRLYKKSQQFSSWMSVCHDVCANATHVYNTCADQSWKSKLKKVLSNEKYGWNGCKYTVQLNKQLMFDLAHDIVYNYMQHKEDKKRKRKF
eukprot:1011277_1